MISKKSKDQLIKWADEVIRSSSIYNKDKGMIVSESYNGQIAAFSVTVALSGLKPAMAVYYSGKGSSDVDKKKIIDLLAAMYVKDGHDSANSDDFYSLVIKTSDQEKLAALQKAIIEYAIALKLAVRTFKFKEKNNESA